MGPPEKARVVGTGGNELGAGEVGGGIVVGEVEELGGSGGELEVGEEFEGALFGEVARAVPMALEPVGDAGAIEGKGLVGREGRR